MFFGFRGVTRLSSIDEGVLLVPLLGHTRGHCAIAVRDGDGWMLHCGDGFYHHSILESTHNSGSLPLRIQEASFAYNRQMLLRNQQHLRQLHLAKTPGLTIINTHDPALMPRT